MTYLGYSPVEALDAATTEFGGFDHNVQTFRVVTELERRYPDFDGLNLSWEMLEGVVKHNGPVLDRLERPSWRPIVKFNVDYDLRLGTYATAEAQAAAIAIKRNPKILTGENMEHNNPAGSASVTAARMAGFQLMVLASRTGSFQRSG